MSEVDHRPLSFFIRFESSAYLFLFGFIAQAFLLCRGHQFALLQAKSINGFSHKKHLIFVIVKY